MRLALSYSLARGGFEPVRRMIGALAAIVYPPSCLACGRVMGASGGVCAGCWSEIRFIERPYCEVTGVPFDHERGEGLISAAALADPPAYDRARAAVLHDGPARKLAHRLKYSDRADLAPAMAQWMRRAAGETIEAVDAIIAVPLHRTRLIKRGYNQAGELARALSAQTGKPLAAGVLLRRKPTEQQVGLGRNARIENVRGAFAVDRAKQPSIMGKHLLLIDDVLTTGATVNAAARVLKRAGAAEVSVLTFARVVSAGAETLYA